MNILSKVSYWKIHWIGTMVELRSALNVLGLNDSRTVESKNRADVFKAATLFKNLNEKDRKRIDRYISGL